MHVVSDESLQTLCDDELSRLQPTCAQGTDWYRDYHYPVLYGASLVQDLKASLAELGIVLKKNEFKLDPKPMLKLTMSRFFDNSYAGLVDALIRHLPSPVRGAQTKITHSYSGSLKVRDGDTHGDHIHLRSSAMCISQ